MTIQRRSVGCAKSHRQLSPTGAGPAGPANDGPHQHAGPECGCNEGPGVLPELLPPIRGRLYLVLQLPEVRLQILTVGLDVGLYLVCCLAHSTLSFTLATVLGAPARIAR